MQNSRAKNQIKNYQRGFTETVFVLVMGIAICRFENVLNLLLMNNYQNMPPHPPTRAVSKNLKRVRSG